MWLLNVNPENAKRAANVYGSEYFPRKFHYKSEAIKAQERAAKFGIPTDVIRKMT